MVMDRIRRIIVKFAEPCNESDSDDYIFINTQQQQLQPVNGLYNNGDSKYSTNFNRRNEQRPYL